MKKYLFLFILTLALSTNIYASFSVQFTSPTNNQVFTPSTPTGTAAINFSYYVDGTRLYHTYATELHTQDNVYYEGGKQQIPQWFYLGGGTYTWTIIEIEYDDLGREPGRVEQTITFYVKYTIYAANNFTGGTINLEGQTVQAGSNSYAYKLVGESVSVGAIDQNDGAGYDRIWNTSGTNNSNWQRNGALLPGATPRNYSYTVASNDNGVTLTADLKKIYHVVLQNTLPEGGGNIGHVIADGTSYNVTAQVPKVELNTMTIQSDNNQPVTNGIASVFNNWSDGNTSSTRSITVGTDLMSYTAIYKGKPLTTGRYLHFNDGAYGSPVTLYWNAHPSSNVTGCKIYQKVRVNGVMGNEYLIASVSAATTSYIDNGYTVSNSTTTQLFYDVRYVYSSTLPDNTPYTTESDPNYVSIYGQIAPSYNDGKKEMVSAAKELPSDYSIGNYPNPFNPTTTINYQLPENGFVTIKVYDVLGKEVATLVNENKSAGYYQINFDASRLTSGVYIYTINVNGFAQSKKMLLMK